MKNEVLMNWIFTFNPYQGIWLATERDNYSDLFSNQESEKLLKSEKIDTLIKFITNQIENE